MTAYKKSNSGFLPFIQKEKVTSPYTDIQNRAKVDASLKTIMGIERVHVNSLNLLTKEVGPAGQQVYEPDNGDSRIRFVGRNITEFSTHGQYAALGARIVNTDDSDYVEVTFYGTGLNGLMYLTADVHNYWYKADGGASVNLGNITGSSHVLGGRNYKNNGVVPIVSGLSLGWHTVKIWETGTDTTQFFFGFEFLNESSQITVKAGKAHGNGYEYELASDQLIDYNLGFDNVLDANVGTRGGRVIVYMDPADGTIKKRLTKTDAAAAYLSSANHSNEAPYRKVNWREFGRNRGDDLSTLSGTTGSSRAFVIEDGTTTYLGTSIGQQVNNGVDCAIVAAGGIQHTFTFVGTGLDIAMSNLAYTGIATVYIDGVSVGTIDNTHASKITIVKIASGLPYGTHTFRLDNTSLGGPVGGFGISDFIIYQPKKPTLPEGAIELADYNIMADFSQTSQGLENVSNGVLRKSSNREFIYKGGGWSLQTDFTNNIGGIYARSLSVSDICEVNFYGSGFDYRAASFVGSAIIEIKVDDILLTAANFPSVSFSAVGGGFSFNSGTGILTTAGGSTVKGCSFSVTGLNLGKHKVEFRNTNGATMVIEAVDVVTPIHSPNTTFGSLSMKDLRNFDSAKDVNKIVNILKPTKNINYDLVNSRIKTSKSIAQVLRDVTGRAHIWFEESFSDDAWMRSGSAYVSNQNAHPAYSAEPLLINAKRKNYCRLVTVNSAGTAFDSQDTTVIFSGKEEKDELEE